MIARMNAANDHTPYYQLDPETVIEAIESLGVLSDGRLLALNSYENRVYQVGLEDSQPLIAKFYRPGRWSDAQIQEEHDFALELAAAEIPLVPPLPFRGKTLHEHAGFRFAVFERRGGHAPELDNEDTRRWLGRFMGRIHAVGANRSFDHRPALTPDTFGRRAIANLSERQCLPAHLEAAFDTLATDLMNHIDAAWEQARGCQIIRLHGDGHVGNILWRDGPFFVDLDDSRSGPAVQDLWMFLSGEADEMAIQMRDIVQGYREFADFSLSELKLIEPLRTLRMLHHASWLAQRWEDPAFPIAFPWFGEPRYWEDLILGLREQLSRLQEQPLALPV